MICEQEGSPELKFPDRRDHYLHTLPTSRIKLFSWISKGLYIHQNTAESFSSVVLLNTNKNSLDTLAEEVLEQNRMPSNKWISLGSRQKRNRYHTYTYVGCKGLTFTGMEAEKSQDLHLESWQLRSVNGFSLSPNAWLLGQEVV